MSFAKGGHFTHVSCDKIVARGSVVADSFSTSTGSVVGAQGPPAQTLPETIILTAEDSNKTFSVFNTTGSENVITLPEDVSVGLTFRLVRTGSMDANVRVKTATGQNFVGRVHDGPASILGLGGTTSLYFISGTGSVGDYLEFHSIGPYYFVKGTCQTTGGITST